MAHIFVDGNKRTAFYICRILLRTNGYGFRPPQDEAVDLFVKMADDKNTGITEQHVAGWIRKYAKPNP